MKTEPNCWTVIMLNKSFPWHQFNQNVMIKIQLQSTLQIFHFMINLCHPLVVIKWLLASSFVITAALAYQGRYFPTFRACD